MKKKDTVKHEETMLSTVYDPQKRIDDYSAPVSRCIDSDESDSDEMLPLGAFWPAPEEEEWTVVERSHGMLRSARDTDSDRLYDSGDKGIVRECAVSSWTILTGMITGTI